jgi:hypothetical protein
MYFQKINIPDPIWNLDGINILASRYILDQPYAKMHITKNVEDIMKYYNNEVLQNNYKPNDFLIVTPFTTKNPLVNALEIAINIYLVLIQYYLSLLLLINKEILNHYINKVKIINILIIFYIFLILKVRVWAI